MSSANARQLVTTMVDLVAQGGLDRLTVREVAAAAGVSIGTVQHYFPTKQGMLLACLSDLTEGFQLRLRAAVESADSRSTGPTGPSEADMLGRLALELLPLDAEREREARVGLAFLARATVDPKLAAVHTAGWSELEEVIAELLRGHRGHRRVGARDRADAASLLATLDGLALTALVEPGRLPKARVRRIALDRVRQVLSSAD